MNRVELLHAIHEWCAGAFNPLIGFPTNKGFPNVVYLYEEHSDTMLESVGKLMSCAQRRLNTPIMVFVEPISWAPKTALTYKQWIEAGDIMKAVEIKTGETVFVLPVYNDDNKVIRYVSSDKAYDTNELKITKEEYA